MTAARLLLTANSRSVWCLQEYSKSLLRLDSVCKVCSIFMLCPHRIQPKTKTVAKYCSSLESRQHSLFLTSLTNWGSKVLILSLEVRSINHPFPSAIHSFSRILQIMPHICSGHLSLISPYVLMICAFRS